ncbi:hypothetical protein [Streptomyces sp. NPDC051776]|uniref:hypothetical protein n=1 Tax=Streptomyces sp. NPDC051776 TaxID=3155414 RepID=UPI0034250628
MRVHKVATATMVVLAMGGWAALGSGTAFAGTGPTGGKAKARATGGSSTGSDVFQQNIAQSARQNNNCSNPNTGDETTSLTGSRAAGRCVTSDGSLTAFSRIQAGRADAEGGSAPVTPVQQNIAQRGRQNNNCNSVNTTITVTGGRVEGRCTDQDLSYSKHTHIKGRGALAEGGSATLDQIDQQNIAQEGRQNNNCNTTNDLSNIALDGGRVEARCGNKDRSFGRHTHVKSGGARAHGGSSTTSFLDQQNVAQEGRQNNNCTNPNGDASIALDGGRVEARCGNKDGSFSKHTRIKGGGARAEGGSSTSSSVEQQNVAQEGRQNNNCNNPNSTDITVDGGRLGGRCGNKDGSFSKHTRIKGGGARAEGGSSTSSSVEQQNVAQEGRQNNNCNNPNGADITVEGGRLGGRCGNKDGSFSKHTLIKGGGARAEGGSSTASSVDQENIAQEGRQNNTCNLANSTSDIEVTGGRVETRCGNKDGSFSKHTHVKGGGARAEGGSSTAGSVGQQNIAQEGRQNNTCNLANDDSGLDLEGGRVNVLCGNKDGSLSKHTHLRGGGARAEGGSSTGGGVFQQNIAQEGRQNNTCNNPNNDDDLTVTDGQVRTRCGNKDGSFSKHTHLRGGGARAEGGSSTGGSVGQQNTAQEGRQNNTCNNANDDADLTVTDGQVRTRCGNKDFSINRETRIKGGGARAEGGSTGGSLNQQNTAQAGRQNNTCNNPNSGEFVLTQSQHRVGCQTVDGSTNFHTTDTRGRAQAEGGSSTAGFFQQNTAQFGRQSNNCANPNNLTLTTTGSRTQSQCVAEDRSTNIATINR